jgi:hypothetical protein
MFIDCGILLEVMMVEIIQMPLRLSFQLRAATFIVSFTKKTLDILRFQVCIAVIRVAFALLVD